MLYTEKSTQISNTPIDSIKPNWVPKNFWNTAPVYPSNADMSSFNKINILDKSIGLSSVATIENLSNGYDSNMIRDVKNSPS